MGRCSWLCKQASNRGPFTHIVFIIRTPTVLGGFEHGAEGKVLRIFGGLVARICGLDASTLREGVSVFIFGRMNDTGRWIERVDGMGWMG